MNVVEASGLGKRDGGARALGDCMAEIPAGRAAASAGPNGVGRSTLVNLPVGLAVPGQAFAQCLAPHG
jgi:ABC-type branched-subunit amino acid transport system ATPase component